MAELSGWRRACVGSLRATVRASATPEEIIKWGHILYIANGPVMLIRAEEERVLFGFWRGQRLGDIEGRLKPRGKYEMAAVELRAGDTLAPAVVRRLTKAAVALNKSLGNPTHLANCTAVAGPLPWQPDSPCSKRKMVCA